MDSAWLHFPIQKGWTIVILGAGVGNATVEFSRLVGHNGLIVSVEPVFKNYVVLERKILENHITHAIPVNAAVWNKVGWGEINLKGRYSSSLLFHRGNETQKTRTITWDYLVEMLSLGHVDYAKVDVEGAEINMLKGMDKVYPDRMIIEQHARLAGNPKVFLDELYLLLKKKGYKVTEDGLYLYAVTKDGESEHLH